MKRTTNKIFYFSLAHALALLIATYIVWNLPDDWIGSGSFLQDVSIARTLSSEVDSLPEDLVLINTCYDHCMIPAYDDIGIECGEIDITDRSKLLRLLEYLAAEDNYRYVVLDIQFDSLLSSPSDSALYSFLSKFPRCCIPRSSSEKDLIGSLGHIYSVSEYDTNIENNNFLKYQYLTPYGESIALKMAKDINDINIDKYGPFYFIGYKMCINSHILDIKTNVMSEYRENQEKNILQLGTDVLPLLDSGMRGMFENKIVMIGDCFKDDIHTTVVGPVSGLMIIYNAYHALLDKDNIPSLLLWIVLFFVYFFITIILLYDVKLYQFTLFDKIKSLPLLFLLIEWAGFGLVFSLIGVLSYFISNTYVDAWICASYFTLFDRVCGFLRNYKKIDT